MSEVQSVALDELYNARREIARLRNIVTELREERRQHQAQPQVRDQEKAIMKRS